VDVQGSPGARLVAPVTLARKEGALSVAFDATPLLGHPTGVGRFCGGALGALARRSDVDVSAYAVSWRRRRGIDPLVPSGVSTRQRAMPARPLQAAWRRGRLPPVEWFVGRRDVVHGSNFVVPPAAHARRVVTVHDLTVVRYPELCDPASLRFPDLVRRALAEGAWVHTPSQFVADEVVVHFGADPGRVRAVHHGIPRTRESGIAVADAGPDTDDHAARREPPSSRPPLELPDGCARYIVAVGTIEPRKDYPLLISAFNRVAANHPEVALVIVGGRGWGSKAVDAAVAASPVAHRIVRPGYLDDATVDAVIAAAGLLAFPSVYEGFGFPPLQAMSVGVPVVATAAGAVPEVVGDGALLVQPGDIDAVAGAMANLLEGGTDVDALVARGRRRSRAFTWEACAAGLTALYRDALDETGAGRL
jgi:glycosyltransferase involved in cell wall biosynthesis